MPPDTSLILDSFQFTGREIPAQIAVGGVQQLVVHELVGGIRVVDAMGRLDHALEWSGWFMGANSEARVAALEAYRVAGLPLSLTWAQYSYQVIVREFAPIFRRIYEYTYRIVCEIVADLTTAATADTSPDIDSAVNDDLDDANDLATTVADPRLLGLMATLSTAVGAVATFAGVPPSVVAGVLQPLSAAVARGAILTAAGNTSIVDAPGFAGVVAGSANPGAGGVALTAQLGTVQQLVALYQLQAALGRISANLSSVNASENTVTTAGGNLFQVAQQQYGDPTAWTGIAKANDLTDPFVQGTAELAIPATADDSGGVLAS
jgi:hypothetical protein